MQGAAIELLLQQSRDIHKPKAKPYFEWPLAVAVFAVSLTKFMQKIWNTVH